MSKQEQDFRVWLDEQMDPDFIETDLWPRLVRFVAEWLDGFADDNTASLVKQAWREEMGGE
jgi:hypothetical protein